MGDTIFQNLEDYKNCLRDNAEPLRFWQRLKGVILYGALLIGALFYSEKTFIERLSPDCLRSRTTSSLQIVGKIVSEWSSRDLSQRRFLAENIEGELAVLHLPNLPWERLGVGDVLKVKGNLRTFCRTDKLKDWERSYLEYLSFKGVSGFIFTEDYEVVLSSKRSTGSLKSKLTDRILAAGIKSEKGRDLVLAATLGEGSLLGGETRTKFQKLGLSHLLVISGFHIGVAYLMFQSFAALSLRRFTRFYLTCPLSVLTGGAGLFVAWLYVAFIGYSVSTVRALFMLSLLVFVRSAQASAAPWRSLCSAAIFILFLWPGSHRQVGTQLVFSALFGIGLALTIISPWLWSLVESGEELSEPEREPSVSKYLDFRRGLVSASLVSLMAFLATSPVVWWHFGNFTPYQPLNSLLVSPVFSFICIWLGIIGVFLFLVSGLVLPLEIACRLAEGLLRVLNYLPVD